MPVLSQNWILKVEIGRSRCKASVQIANKVAHARGNNPFGGTRWLATGLVVARHEKKRSPIRASATLFAMAFRLKLTKYAPCCSAEN